MIEFYSSEGTKYVWDSSTEKIMDLTPKEIQMTKIKVKLMSDQTILNQISGNNIQMGIPLFLSRSRLKEVYSNFRRVVKGELVIHLESHAINRLVEDWALDDNHPGKRGWKDEEDIRNCVRTVNSVLGLRLNVNHHHIENRSDKKYLYPQIAMTIQGKKQNGVGRLVSAVLSENLVTVITVL